MNETNETISCWKWLLIYLEKQKREKENEALTFFQFIFSLFSGLFWALRSKVVEIFFGCFICYCLIFIAYHNDYYNRLSQSRRWPTPFWLNETKHLSVSMQKYWLKVFEHISSFSFQWLIDIVSTERNQTRTPRSECIRARCAFRLIRLLKFFLMINDYCWDVWCRWYETNGERIIFVLLLLSLLLYKISIYY